MVRPLSDITDGSDLFIDTNIFIYGLTGKSPECKTLLERCSTERIAGMSLFEVLHEATHKFMIAEATQKGYFAGQPEKGAKYLARNPAQVRLSLRLLDQYSKNPRSQFALSADGAGYRKQSSFGAGEYRHAY